MKILQIAPPWIDTPPQDYGGTEWVIANLTKGLTELGHDVTVFATKNSKVSGQLRSVFERGLTLEGIDWKAGLPPLYHYHQAFRLAFQFDVVHAHLSSGTDLVTLPFLADLTEQGIPNILTIHGHAPYDKYSKMDSKFLSTYGPSITAVNISQFMSLKTPKDFWNGGTVYNSLDLSSYKFSSKGGNYFTWIGKIIPKKGLLEAIKIAKEAQEQLIFAGIVDPYREESVKYFEQDIKPLIDNKQIKYLGPADLKLKNKLLTSAKAFLNPLNWEEPFGMVMVESLACGTPVITFDKGAASEIVKDCLNGFVVKNAKEMLKAIKQVDKIKRKDCRKSVEQNFTPKVAALNYLGIYRKEIQKHLQEDRALFDKLGSSFDNPFKDEYGSAIAHSLSIFPKKES